MPEISLERGAVMLVMLYVLVGLLVVNFSRSHAERKRRDCAPVCATAANHQMLSACNSASLFLQGRRHSLGGEVLLGDAVLPKAMNP